MIDSFCQKQMKRVFSIFLMLAVCFFIDSQIGFAQSGHSSNVDTNRLSGINPVESIDDSVDINPDSEPENYDDAYYDEEDEDYLYEDEEAAVLIADPLEPWNMLMFRFNDKMYFWVLKPVGQGYAYVLPDMVRRGIWNFFSNLESPLQFANCLLQGKGSDAEATFARFFVNTTIGFLGFGNPASAFPKLKKMDEDFGQTLGYWGIGDGWYVTWPVLGPSTIRDSVGMAGDMFLNPTFYINAIELSSGLWALDNINRTSFRIGDYETIKGAALDPYEAIRDGYLQLRKNKVVK
jgi:phospholipid-binding lipoprotein MlaA